MGHREVERRRAAAALAVLGLTSALVAGGALNASAGVEVPEPVLEYTFDGLAGAGAGTVVQDSGSASHPGTVLNTGASLVTGPTGHEDDRALSLPGGANTAAAPYVRIAPGLLDASTTDVTMSAWIRWSGAPACTWPFTLGSAVERHVFATTDCGGNAYGAIRDGNEVRATGQGTVPTNRWAHLAVVVDGGTSVSTYLDGVRVGHAATTHTAAAAVGTATFSGYVGKSFYAADAYWDGAIDDVRVYTEALTAEQLQEAERAVYAAVAQRDVAVDLGDTSAVENDLDLATVGAGGSTLTWVSSAPDVVSTTGVVTRPTAGEPDERVTLTPTASFGPVTVVGAPIAVTVRAWAEGDGPEAFLARQVAARIPELPAFQGDVLGSLTLPESGSDVAPDMRGAEAATIVWRSSDDAVISDTDSGTAPDVVRKGSVTRGERDTTVTLTATVAVAGAESVDVDVVVNVPADPRIGREDFEAYMFAYFTADSIEGEKIRFATSDGNDALRWKELNGAQPVLESTKGTMGLRDPFIMRSHEGDRFFLLATDLSVGRTGWGGATDRGSRHLEIWESTDLVNWGEQRHVEVNLPNAGMTWAPEAFYDESIDAYLVYWTSTMYSDEARTVQDGNGPQILTSITRDFRTFTDPEPWFKAADVPGLVEDRGLIDSTVLKDGDTYYRFTKATQASGCPSPDIIGQRSTSLRATTASGAWQLVDTCIGRTAGTPEVEGPSAFLANDDDVNGNRYYLWVDDYGGVGYIPLMTDSLEGDVAWTYPSSFSLPRSPRHGSVIGITRAERDALAARWAPNLLVTDVAPVALDVEIGTTSVDLPATVTATFRDGHTEQVAVAWDHVDLGQLTRPGDTVTVEGRLANGAGTPAVATLTAVGDPQTQVPLEVELSPRCLAGKVYLAVRATNAGDVPVDVTLTTPFGERSFADVAPGKSAYQSFATRTTSVAAGTVTVAGWVDGGTPTSYEVAFDARACG
ncbi:family 43 glycosylhydrolase [Cellulosimicrobium cellulans]|uniref:LamG-like jellyroll fold domain-containing protein n=1 Tax=Cellulosimicrobium cellulans TaxID=1710 RepID=UPI001965C640|nr:LamG-like jellyroll fold domain-containing protein [Cellulosimicrobium cellulans]MBN0038579.1 family 43 glycosylhydrolase [Cellulosimicrobium cellulans]